LVIELDPAAPEDDCLTAGPASKRCCPVDVVHENKDESIRIHVQHSRRFHLAEHGAAVSAGEVGGAHRLLAT
jgi:hypothetical protein